MLPIITSAPPRPTTCTTTRDGRSPQGDADAQVALAPADEVGSDAVDPHRSEHHREHREEREDRHHLPRGPDRLCEHRLEGGPTTPTIRSNPPSPVAMRRPMGFSPGKYFAASA